MDSKNLKKIIADEQNELIQLLNEWDPIRVLPFENGNKDEYDCFVSPIISLLNKGANEEKLAAFLNSHLSEHMGLDPNDGDTEKFAADKKPRNQKNQESKGSSI